MQACTAWQSLHHLFLPHAPTDTVLILQALEAYEAERLVRVRAVLGAGLNSRAVAGAVGIPTFKQLTGTGRAHKA